MMREQILALLERNSKLQPEEIAVLLGSGADLIRDEIIAERIYNYPEVQSVYLISGAYDLLVILEGKTLQEVASFVSSKLSTLDTVISTATHFILKKYKDDGIIFEQKKKDERMKVTP